MNNLDGNIAPVGVKIQLKEIIDIISLAYIAKTYFGKSKSWLYHRIKGSIVNGKPAKFKEDEILLLNSALQDISKKIGLCVIVV